MLDLTLDYRRPRTLTVTGNGTSHSTPCEECQDVVRHNHVSPLGVPHYHIVGTAEMHEVVLAAGRGSFIKHRTPSCTCTNGKVQLARNKPAVCYHVDSALVLFHRWFEGLETMPVITSLTPYELFEGDECDQPAAALPAGIPFPLGASSVKFIDCGLTALFDKVFSA